MSRTRRNQAGTDEIYELGQKGRKTGITLPDKGIRDEHGLEPVSGIFSSPGKEDSTAGGGRTGSGEADMDLDDDSGPAPHDVITGRRSQGGARSIPRARSPTKTNLKSPAKKLQAGHALRSSPLRGSVVPGSDDIEDDSRSPAATPSMSVSRRLDYGKADPGAGGKGGRGGKGKASPANGTAKVNGVRSRAGAAALANGHAHDDEDDDEEAILHGQDDDEPVDGANDSIEMLDGGRDYGGGDDDPTPPDVYDEESVAKPARRRRSARTSRDAAEDGEAEEAEAQLAEEARASQKRGPNGKPPSARATTSKGASKRRASVGESTAGEDDDESVQAPRKRQRVASAVAKGKGRLPAVEEDNSGEEAGPSARPASSQGPRKRGRPPAAKRVQDETVGDDSSLKVQRGPPRPKQGGLMIARKEGANSWVQTRSGRNSVRPVEYWRGERIDYDEEELVDETGGGKKFVVQKMKEVVRVDQVEDKKPSRPRPRATSKKPKRQRHDSSDDDDSNASANEADDWEEQGSGTIRQEVFMWRPEHELNPPSIDDPAEFIEERLALAARAIKTQDILTADFKYVKTLSMPFFGSGVVDMPAGSEKKTKNSRRMHMVFFVHKGRVKVTINDFEFRIRKGGMWFVPRGNWYSIKNEHRTPARLIFAQACEILTSLDDQNEAG